MSERPSCSRDGVYGLYIGVWSMNSFLDSETLREEKFGPKRRAGIQN